MEFRILGPVEVVAGGQLLALGGRKPRTLLAALLMQANEVVATERLIDALWEDRPPETARAALQVHVSQLRKLLGRDRIVTRAPGYLLRVELGELDLDRFERLVSEARDAAGSAAAAKLRQALALWRGPPLAEFADEQWAQSEIARVEERRLSVLQDRIDADLALGRHGELVGELERLVADHPLAERLRGQLMLALYRSGRQAEALDAYRSARATLVEQLGIEPGSALRRLERAVLDQDPKLDVVSVAPEPGLEPRLRLRSTSFVGRVREQREIRTLLDRADVRLLTLTGAAGTGKTRLAVEATAALDAELPGAAVLVELAPIGEADLVATTIAGALGLTERPGRGSLEALVASLRGRRTVLVLDNFEQVLAAAPMLTELLAGAPGVTLLVTSRSPLDVPDERIYPVPALQLPDPSRRLDVGRLRRTEAVRLFVARARDARADFELSELNADAVAELCLRLDGLPLALELAAARIKVLSPRDIVERLGVRLEVLKAEPGAGLPERHRTLRAAIEWSYDLLGAEEQALFTSLGVFVGGFTLDGASAIASDFEFDVVAGVESLLNNSLLRTEPMAGGEPRFGMLETIREYALERLAERGDVNAVRGRHAGFYLPLAEEAEPALLGPQQLSWLQRLDAERDNLRAALTWATEDGDAEVGLRIGAALWRFWQLRGSDIEGRERLERLLARRGGSKTTRALAQVRAASLAFVQGDHEAVRRHIEASLPVLRRVGDDRMVATYLGVMGTSALALGDTERARTLSDEGLEVALRTGDVMAETYARFNVGVVLAARGKLDEAERAIEESVRAVRQLGNVRSVANWLRSLGGIALARNDHVQARLLFEESLALHRTLGDTWGISHSLSMLGLVLVEARDHDGSRRLVAESVEIERTTGDRPGLVFNLEICAGLAAAERRRERAVRLYACASVLRESVGSHPAEVGWPDHARHVADLRAELGEEAFNEAWAQGRAMTLDESVAYALEADLDPT